MAQQLRALTALPEVLSSWVSFIVSRPEQGAPQRVFYYIHSSSDKHNRPRKPGRCPEAKNSWKLSLLEPWHPWSIKNAPMSLL